MTTDPTTASIAAQSAERDRLQAEVEGLCELVLSLRALLAKACDELVDTGETGKRRAAELHDEMNGLFDSNDALRITYVAVTEDGKRHVVAGPPEEKSS